jgi:murein DD-endopeptidase MepM/ murein hydrolase activator NlpD
VTPLSAGDLDAVPRLGATPEANRCEQRCIPRLVDRPHPHLHIDAVLGRPEAILDAITLTATAAGPSPAAAALHPTTRIVFPLPEGISRPTSGYGYRVHPVFGTRLPHAGTDYAAPAGTPVLALADGVVADVTHDSRGGNLVVLDHVIDGEPVATAYAHLLDGSTTVDGGEPVTAGQQIAAVGSTGAATGPHLHLEVHPGTFTDPAVDFERWSRAHRLDNLTDAAPAACTTGGET